MMLMAAVSLHPTSGPGSAELQTILNEIAFAVLILCAIGWVLGAGVKAIGSGTGNQIMSDRGGNWMGRAFVAALAVGACAFAINFAVTVGGGFH